MTWDLGAAIQSKNWYAVSAILLGALIYAWRKLAPDLWAKVPERWRWLPPMTIGGAMAFVSAFQAGESLQQALISAVAGVWAIALPAIAGHHVLKESPLPYGEPPRDSQQEGKED